MTNSTYNPSSSPTHTAAVMGGTNAEFNIPTTSGGVDSPAPGRAASLRRPSRQTSQSPTSNHMNNLSASREDLKNSMVCKGVFNYFEPLIVRELKSKKLQTSIRASNHLTAY